MRGITPRSPRKNRDSHHSHRAAFTLVEMLVVMLIIALLAAVVLFAVAGAQEQAKASRTRAQITKLDSLIMQQWDTYLSRRVPVAPTDAMLPSPGDSATVAAQKQRQLQVLRLNGLRELMRMELPDHIADIPNDGDNAYVMEEKPALVRSYRRRAEGRAQVDWGQLTADKRALRNQSAECLYLIVESIADADGTGIGFFNQSEIGDIDNDGMHEILDGWGNPIEFLRWAPGYYSLIQPSPFAAEYQITDPHYPDPFDPLQVDDRLSSNTNATFALYPLIVSSGPDGKFDVLGLDKRQRTNNESFDGPTGAGANYSGNDPFFRYTLNVASGYFGENRDTNENGENEFFDNVSNHDLGSQ